MAGAGWGIKTMNNGEKNLSSLKWWRTEQSSWEIGSKIGKIWGTILWVTYPTIDRFPDPENLQFFTAGFMD